MQNKFFQISALILGLGLLTNESIRAADCEKTCQEDHTVCSINCDYEHLSTNYEMAIECRNSCSHTFDECVKDCPSKK
jgi:hypothetical protein